MAHKISLLCTVAIFIIVYSHCIGASEAFCSLEKMKKFAVEACEHLFLNDDPSSVRQKREYHHRSKSNEFGSHNKKHKYAVRRSTYPPGGYLKVAEKHFDHLTKLNIYPMYKHAVHVHKKSHDGNRHKRGAYGGDIGLPYCCVNKCDEDFFCR